MSNKKYKAAPSISRLKLEAIFHPKFENETPDSEIRTKMLAKVTANEGYLEASLKHSGSLLLWSGRQCFYSKNSTGNVFTHVGEIMLMQHFARCYGDTWREEYERCSEYVHTHRLTCSFEVVTSILGHHGDLPKRDYLILIAVADRMDGRGVFYSSNELVRFAHRFRLPHNDAWVFASSGACESLFRVYDTMREVGMATTVIERLDRIVLESEACDGEQGICVRVASLYPHDVFQGDILEGVVIRYVPYANSRTCDDTSAKQKQSMDEMKDLSNASNDLLRLIPPSTTLDKGSADEASIQRVDLRALAAADDFEHKLEQVLRSIHGSNLRQTQNVNKNLDQEQSQSTTKSIDLVNIANEILLTCSTNPDIYDQETLSIARLIYNLDELNIPISYKVLTEESSCSTDERCICILHIHHDSSFQKYHNFLKKEPNKRMLLYRGCSIELVSEVSGSTVKMDVESDAAEIESNPCEEQLMLKMKFLPYMIRTFICRNGLSTLQRSGEQAFVHYAISQLKKWDVSEGAIRKWMPIFKGWAKYSSSPPNTSLPPLTEQNYLHHYNKFAALYEKGEFHPDFTGHATFNGLVVVVGTTRSNLEALSLAVSKELHCSKVVRDIHNLTDKDVLLSLPDSGGGLLCIAEVEDGFGNLRKLAKKNHEAIYIIVVEPDQDELNLFPNKNMRKFNGMMQGWKKTKCNMVLDLPKDAATLVDEDAALEYLRNNSVAKEVMAKLKESSEKNQRDERPGVIVYFPSIPGSGKSSICNNITATSLGMDGDRELIMLEGDKVKGKFYNVITQEILTTKPGSIVILDKNAPPASFSSVHTLCIESKSVAMPVVPCGMEDTLVGSYTYPFTLQYLAVCMSRVLKRQPNSHNGKLDSATDNACMVVVKFYCLYRNMTTTVMRERVINIGHHCKPIIVPFFGDNGSTDLPDDLQTVLMDSIILQTQNDVGTRKVCDEDMTAMEERLRASVRQHQTLIDKMTVPLDVSKETFESELSRAVASLPEQLDALNIAEGKMTKSIKIASLDFHFEEVQNVIEQLRMNHSDVDSYFSQRTQHKRNDENDKSQDRFITSTHCTFAHESQATQATMISSFKHLTGTTFEVNATALLFNGKIAAIELEIPPNPSVPMPCNKFAHITVWCAADTEAYESNLLPEKVQCNEARHILFEEPVKVKGCFSFWYNET